MYFLASFPQLFHGYICFQQHTGFVRTFFDFVKPLPLECPRTIPLFRSHPAIPALACDKVST
jgi:hypothetical protein